MLSMELDVGLNSRILRSGLEQKPSQMLRPDGAPQGLPAFPLYRTVRKAMQNYI